MAIGGASMVMVGLFLGETERVTASSFPPRAIWAFCHLLIVGSLIGYVAYTWLLGHVSTTVAGTYAYVNPAVALLIVGEVAGDDNFQWQGVTGMVVILAGVALVRRGARPLASRKEARSLARTFRAGRMRWWRNCQTGASAVEGSEGAPAVPFG